MNYTKEQLLEAVSKSTRSPYPVTAVMHSLSKAAEKPNQFNINHPHELEKTAEVKIAAFIDSNNVVAEYNGNFYTAILNGFNGAYYVDDIYGLIGPATE